jgi:hypothetical protein
MASMASSSMADASELRAPPANHATAASHQQLELEVKRLQPVLVVCIGRLLAYRWMA